MADEERITNITVTVIIQSTALTSGTNSDYISYFITIIICEWFK